MSCCSGFDGGCRDAAVYPPDGAGLLSKSGAGRRNGSDGETDSSSRTNGNAETGSSGRTNGNAGTGSSSRTDGSGRSAPIPDGGDTSPERRGVCHGMQFVTYSALFQYTLVLAGIAALFIEWFARKK